MIYERLSLRNIHCHLNMIVSNRFRNSQMYFFCYCLLVLSASKNLMPFLTAYSFSLGDISINVISITAETVGRSSVTSVLKGELLSIQMRMLNLFEFVTDAWYVPFLPRSFIFIRDSVNLDCQNKNVGVAFI